MADIGIAHVLAEINQPLLDGDVHYFSIMYIRITDGKTGKAGSAKRVNRCMKYSKTGTGKGFSGGGASLNLRENSILRLRDVETGETIDAKIWTIKEYNGQRVRH